MASVNDLEQRWMPENDNDGFEGGVSAGRESCAFDLRETARTAWHPVSEPPTEADAPGAVPLVLVCDNDGVDCWDYRTVQQAAFSSSGWAKGLKWARIRDVVLMPPGGE